MENSVKRFLKKPMAVISILVLVGAILTVYSLRKTVTINVDGKKQEVVTYKTNVKNLLKDINLDTAAEDKIEPSLDSKISNKDEIKIKKAVNVSFVIDGKKLSIKSAADRVENLVNSPEVLSELKSQGLASINEMDKVQPERNAKVSPGMEVLVKRVTKKTEVSQEKIAFAEEKVKDANKVKGTEEVVSEGEEGIEEVTKEVVLEDGQVISTSITGKKIVKAPVNRKVVYGTKNKILDRGNGDEYVRAVSMRSTAYSAQQPGLSNTTASGRLVKRDPSGYSTVAVDPSVIPLGTKLYIDGYGYAIAADTGGAIKGNKLDVYFNTISECNSWGVRYVNVYVLA